MNKPTYVLHEVAIGIIGIDVWKCNIYFVRINLLLWQYKTNLFKNSFSDSYFIRRQYRQLRLNFIL